jgi:transcriptional regulator with XRE-family HTH domain
MRPKSIPEKIRSHRIQNKYTREQVVSILAISMQDYIAYETGSKEIPLSLINDFVDLYGQDTKYWTPLHTVQ